MTGLSGNFYDILPTIYLPGCYTSMRIRSKIILLFLLVCFSSFYPAGDTDFNVSVTGLRNNKGFVLISLFKEGVGFPNQPEKAFRKEKINIINNRAYIVFSNVPEGNYAIAFLHDENNDYKMNTNFFGIPKEGYGFSNNAIGVFGPPPYSKASFRLPQPGTNAVLIKARY